MAYGPDAGALHNTADPIDYGPTSGDQYVFDLSGQRVGKIPAGSGTSDPDRLLTIGSFTPGYVGPCRLGNAAGVD